MFITISRCSLLTSVLALALYHSPPALALSGAPFPVFQSDAKEIFCKFRRRDVDYKTTEPARTLVGYGKNRFFYHMHGDGRATHYGVAMGNKPARPSPARRLYSAWRNGQCGCPRQNISPSMRMPSSISTACPRCRQTHGCEGHVSLLGRGRRAIPHSRLDQTGPSRAQCHIRMYQPAQHRRHPLL